MIDTIEYQCRECALTYNTVQEAEECDHHQEPKPKRIFLISNSEMLEDLWTDRFAASEVDIPDLVRRAHSIEYLYSKEVQRVEVDLPNKRAIVLDEDGHTFTYTIFTVRQL